MKYLQPRFSKANCSHYLQRNKKTQNCLLPLFFLHLNSFELVTSFYSRYLPTTYLKQNFNSSNNLFHLSESNVFRYSCEEHFAAESPSENQVSFLSSTFRRRRNRLAKTFSSSATSGWPKIARTLMVAALRRVLYMSK